MNTEIGKLYGARLKPHLLPFRVFLNRALPNIILAGEALNVQNPLKNATEVLNWTIASLENALKQFCVGIYILEIEMLGSPQFGLISLL